VYVLLIDYDGEYDPADVHGPFATLLEATEYAENWRETNGLPRVATAENNEEWTAAGWYFGIVQPRIMDAGLRGT
jgi:hypothetical protein